MDPFRVAMLEVPTRTVLAQVQRLRVASEPPGRPWFRNSEVLRWDLLVAVVYLQVGDDDLVEVLGEESLLEVAMETVAVTMDDHRMEVGFRVEEARTMGTTIRTSVQEDGNKAPDRESRTVAALRS